MRIKSSAARLLIITAAIIAWELVTRLGMIPSIMLTPPSAVIQTLIRILISPTSLSLKPQPTLEFYSNLRLTSIEIIAAFAIVSTVGLTLGFVIGSIKSFAEIFEPILVAVFAIPNVVLYPIILLLFGFGLASKIAFGVVLGFFPVVSSTVAGLRQIEKSLVTVAVSIGASKLQIFQKVIIPAASISIVSGLKQGLSLTVIGVIAAELISSPFGLGYLLTYELSFFQTNELLALVMVIVAVTMTGLQAFEFIESHLRK